MLAAGFERRAEIEDGCNHGTGPKWSSLQEASESFSSGAAALNDVLARPLDDQTAGDRQLGPLSAAAARGDQKAFMDAVGEIGAIIASLNAVDPKPIIASTGMATVSANGINLQEETADFEAKAEKTMADRKRVVARHR